MLIGGKVFDVPVSNCTWDRNPTHDWTRPKEARQVKDKKQVILTDPRRPLRPVRPAADKFDVKELESFLGAKDFARIEVGVPIGTQQMVVDPEADQRSITESTL